MKMLSSLILPKKRRNTSMHKTVYFTITNDATFMFTAFGVVSQYPILRLASPPPPLALVLIVLSDDRSFDFILQLLQSFGSTLSGQYPSSCLKSSIKWPILLPTNGAPFNFPSMTSRNRQFLLRMCPVFLYVTVLDRSFLIHYS